MVVFLNMQPSEISTTSEMIPRRSLGYLAQLWMSCGSDSMALNFSVLYARSDTDVIVVALRREDTTVPLPSFFWAMTGGWKIHQRREGRGVPKHSCSISLMSYKAQSFPARDLKFSSPSAFEATKQQSLLETSIF